MFRLIFCALSALALATPAAAQDLDLYQAEVEVPDQSLQSRAAGLAEALAQVLVKNTGNPDAARAPGVQPYLNQAAQYAQQFSYGAGQRLVPGAEVPESVLTLSARFDPRAVQRILGEAGLPRWGAQRPATLLWIAMETPQEGRVLVGDENSVVTGAAKRAASRRGLPILFPLLDLEDQRAVSMRELWGGFVEPMLEASARYGTETFLLGRLEPRGDEQWAARWVLYDQGRQGYLDAGPGRLDAVVTAGIDFAATSLGTRFAVSTSEQTGVGALIAVHGVQGVSDYARLLDYLSGLTVIEGAQIVLADGDRLDLRLELSSGLGRLDQVVALGRVLGARQEPVNDGPGQPIGARVYQREYMLLP